MGLALLHNAQFSRLLLENSVPERYYVPFTNFSVLSTSEFLIVLPRRRARRTCASGIGIPGTLIDVFTANAGLRSSLPSPPSVIVSTIIFHQTLKFFKFTIFSLDWCLFMLNGTTWDRPWHLQASLQLDRALTSNFHRIGP